MFKIADVIKLLTRIFVKQNKRFPKGLESVDIRITAKEIFDVGKSQGYKGGISENQLKHFLAWKKQAKPIETTVKKGEVFDLTGKKIDTSKPILGGKNVELTHNEKIDWLVKNVSPTAEQTIPPKATLEAMLKDGREDLIDHFFEMHTKKLSGKPQINIDTSDLKHPELVKKMMMDEKLKPTLVKTEAQIKTKLEGLNKKTIERIRRRRYEAALKAEREKMAKDSEYIPEILDPDDFAYGGLAGMLGEPTYADGGRVPLGAGKFVLDAARRKFLQMMGAGAAGVGVAKSGLFGLLKGGGKKQVVESLTQIPIEQVGVGYMPPWFKPLVNKVIKEGDDVTKKFATKEREIVHTKKLDDFEEVTVHQNLDEGTIEVSYKTPDSMAEAGVDFKYTAPQKMVTKKGPVKTEPKFEAVESYPESHAIGPDDAKITFEGENVVGMVDYLFSDTSKLKQYATGKKLTKLEQEVAKKKIDKVTKINNDPSAQSDLLPDYDPYASGGRVPLGEGGIGDTEIAADIDKSLNQLMEDFKLYKDYGGRGNLKDYINKYRALRFLHKEGGRVPMFAGGSAWKKFIEMLFIKSSNQIRRGEGIFKGLTEKQRIVQHDNLTKLSEKFRKTGKFDKGANQYFGIDAEEAFAKVEAQVKKPHGFIKKGDPITSENFGASQFAPSNERAMIKQKYPGITDDLLNKILIDDNPQRKAEVLATLDQYFELGKRGKSMEEASEIVKQGIKHRTKQSTGGLAGMLGE